MTSSALRPSKCRGSKTHTPSQGGYSRGDEKRLSARPPRSSAAIWQEGNTKSQSRKFPRQNTTYNSHNSSSNRRQQWRRQHRQSKPPRRLRPTTVTNRRRRRTIYRWKKFSQKQNKKQETNSVRYEKNGMLVFVFFISPPPPHLLLPSSENEDGGEGHTAYKGQKAHATSSPRPPQCKQTSEMQMTNRREPAEVQEESSWEQLLLSRACWESPWQGPLSRAAVESLVPYVHT